MATNDYIINLETNRNEISNILTSRGISQSPSTNLGSLVVSLSGLEKSNAFTENAYFKSGKITISEHSKTISITGLPRKPKKLFLTRWQTQTDDVPTIADETKTVYGICQAVYGLFNQNITISSGVLSITTSGLFWLVNKTESVTNAVTTKVQAGSAIELKTFAYSDGAFTISSSGFTLSDKSAYFYAGEYEWQAEFDDSEFFEITDGVISLKAEYQNGGALNSSLPESLVIPNEIEGVQVTAYAEAMFKDNTRIKHLTLANNITTIPSNFCYNATNLIQIDNTSYITTINSYAFCQTSLLEIHFPSVTFINTYAFRRCCLLEKVNFGSITTLSKGLFYSCHNLQTVTGLSNVKNIGASTFMYTQSLKNVDIDVSKIEYVLPMSFRMSGIDLEWENVKEGCTILPWSTSNHYWQNGVINSNDKPWLNGKITACIKPVPMSISQTNPLWANRNIGNVDYTSGACYAENIKPYYSDYSVMPFTYKIGCAILSVYQAYLGIYHPERIWVSVPEIEEQIKSEVGDIFTDLINDTSLDLFIVDNTNKTIQPSTLIFAKYIAEHLGMTYTNCVGSGTDGIFTSEDYNKFYNALATKNTYVLINVSAGDVRTGGHAVIAYGIDKDGNVLVTDTSALHREFGIYSDFKFKIPTQNLLTSGDYKQSGSDPNTWVSCNAYTKPFVILSKST